MNWDSIEVKWSEMARRAMGQQGVARSTLPAASGNTQFQPQTLADDVASVAVAVATALKPGQSSL